MKREIAFLAAGGLLGAAAVVVFRPTPVPQGAVGPSAVPVIELPRPDPSTKVGWQAVPGGRIYRVPGEGICFVPEPAGGWPK